MHVTPLSHKLGGTGGFKSSIFLLSLLFWDAVNVASWYLTFLPNTDT